MAIRIEKPSTRTTSKRASTPPPAPAPVRGEARPPRKAKVIRAPDFAKRLNTACEDHGRVPLIHQGRQVWLRDQLAARFDEGVTIESVRKWLAGETKPKPDKLKKLADLLEADEAWLSLGYAPDMSPRERRARDASADGAVNLVAGFIQMARNQVSFPERGSRRAQDARIDLNAIMRGRHYDIHISLALETKDGFRFSVPARYEETMLIGVVPGQNLSVRLVEIVESLVAAGSRRGGGIEVTMTDAEVEAHRIRGFDKPI